MGWGDPVEAFPWPVVELRGDGGEGLGDGGEGLGAVNAEVAVLREVLPEPIHVLVGAPLPWFAWVGEEHTVAEERRDLVVAGHLGPLIPRQCAPLVRRQLRHRCGECPVDL